MRRIGVDVGGTNTDAVLLDGGEPIATIKLPTTVDLMDGLVAAISAVLAAQSSDDPPVEAVMIGTTQFTNAVIERSRLERVAALRIGLPASASLPPGVDWPDDLRAVVDPLVFMVRGGHEYDGRPIVPLDRDAVRAAAQQIGHAGIRSVAISAIFSPLTAEAESDAAEILRDELPDIAVSCSSDLGRIGLLERENVTMLNACLRGLGLATVRAFEDALATVGLDVPAFLTQNDGTVVRAEVAARTPVMSFASGPTNSMRGAAYLSGLSDAVVVDVGGTTSDIGHLRGGFPRQANNVVLVGGVRTLFRMPDLSPIGLGGGSIVSSADALADGRSTAAIGPRSVGYRITSDAPVFGGSTLTATGVAVAAGRADIGDASLVAHLDAAEVAAHLAEIGRMLEASVDRVRTSDQPVDLIAVGGGAFLVPDSLAGVAAVHRVAHAGVANAVGAAMAQISGEVDQVFSGLERSAAIDQAIEIAS
ncbi:hydantoinase/oxoprolinase family protein [soil metagenome]